MWIKAISFGKKVGIRNVEHLIFHRPKVPQTLTAQEKQSCAHITDFSEIRYIEIEKDLHSQWKKDYKTWKKNS